MKIGLIGINSIEEEKKFELIQQTLKKNLYALFSPHFEDMHIFAKKYNIKVYSSANNLFSDVDAIYFARSLKPNLDFAVHALKRSCHLFMEDISELSTDELKYLYKLAFEAGVLLIIKGTILFSPEFRLISKEISCAKIVELDYFYNRILRKKEFFYEVFEAVRAISALIQSGIKRINTTPIKIDQNLISFVIILLEFDNGAIAKIKINNLTQENGKKIEVYETSDYFETDLNKQSVYKNSYIKGHAERKELEVPKEDPFALEIKDFIVQTKNVKNHYISESPEMIQKIQATQSILQKIYQ
ncbi:MAG: Gfo/Idh/MocA family oxidoreductase [Bacteroidales bacterium]|jgi:predicted dehydrogenase|nr:Gfo/Idh/MocA family oxidoreductase [Bacteroidales bacterium]